MANSQAKQRVAIAGTVINTATGEVMPQVLVRITQGPGAFITMLMDTIETIVHDRPKLEANYRHLLTNRPITPDTLRTAQIILDSFERSQLLTTPRCDQTVTGGDGHYCFLDLPPGHYELMAALTTLDHCHGSTRGQVQVERTEHWLAFSALDMALTLVPNSLTLPTLEAVEEQGTRIEETRRLMLR